MKILFIDDVHEILDIELTQNGFECLHFESKKNKEIKKAIQLVEGIVIRSRFPINKEIINSAKKLKFIARSGAGMENIDESYCYKKNIKLFNAPEGNRDAVGEHGVAMLLMLLNKLHLANTEVKNGQWNREKNRGIELGEKTVGIIGYGNNGKAFAKKLSGFNTKVLAYDKYKKNFGDAFVKESSMEDIFKLSDIISFHIPQNNETLFLANELFFDSFKKQIYVINLSRGKIIKTSALVNSMKSGKIQGACLDVLEYEKDSFENMFERDISEEFQFLINSDKVILSPHIAGWTNESYYKLSKILAKKIIQWKNKL